MSKPMRERRATPPSSAASAELRAGLSPAQLATLKTMEQFQWELRFVRRPMFLAPVPVLFDRSGQRYVVLNEDGSIDQNPTLRVRG